MIGGTVATNAGGNRVLSYGMARASVAGLEVVLANGRILSGMRGLVKNNAGFELRQLFIGSEGLLGVVTQVMLRLQSLLPCSGSALPGFRDFDTMLACLGSARAEFGALLTGFKAMWPDYWRILTGPGVGRRSPLAGRHGLYALVETQGRDPGYAAFMTWLEKGVEQGLFEDAAVARSDGDLADFWALREAAAEVSKVVGKCHGYDIGTRPAQVGPCVEACRAALEHDCPKMDAMFFGYVGDGNTHIMLAHRPGFDSALVARANAAIYPVVAQFFGTMTAEHGIGALKRDWLVAVRSSEEIAVMKTLKQTLDPAGILNPGKVLPPPRVGSS